MQSLVDLIRAVVAYPLLGVALVVLLGALLVAAVAVIRYALRRNREISFGPLKIGPPRPDSLPGRIAGSRLFQHAGFYPIDIEPKSNTPTLNPEIYVRAMHYLLESVDDRLAAMDLVYLREDNRQALGDVLSPEHLATYERLIAKYRLTAFRVEATSETDRLFRNATRIITDLAATLSGIRCELVLHDVRNPLRSIVALGNTEEVSKRRLHGPSTRFVVQYLKYQGRHLIALEHGSHVAYKKWFSKTKQVKATTTPLFDERYGLIGLLCVNIDIDAVSAMDEAQTAAFLDAYVHAPGSTPEYEREDAPST